MDSLARIGEAEGEQVAGHQLACEPHGDVAEVDFGLHAGVVGLRDECLQRGFARLHQDLWLPVRDVTPNLLVGDVSTVFLDQAVEDPRDGVALLARRVQVRQQDAVDDRLVRVQRGCPRGQFLPRCGPDRVDGLPDRPPRHVVLTFDLPELHAAAVVTPDRGVQLNLRHLRHDQGLSPGAPRCCPGKYPGAVKTREHHPTVDRGASQTREQLPSRLVNRATPILVARSSTPMWQIVQRLEDAGRKHLPMAPERGLSSLVSDHQYPSRRRFLRVLRHHGLEVGACGAAVFPQRLRGLTSRSLHPVRCVLDGLRLSRGQAGCERGGRVRRHNRQRP